MQIVPSVVLPSCLETSETSWPASDISVSAILPEQVLYASRKLLLGFVRVGVYVAMGWVMLSLKRMASEEKERKDMMIGN